MYPPSALHRSLDEDRATSDGRPPRYDPLNSAPRKSNDLLTAIVRPRPKTAVDR